MSFLWRFKLTSLTLDKTSFLVLTSHIDFNSSACLNLELVIPFCLAFLSLTFFIHDGTFASSTALSLNGEITGVTLIAPNLKASSGVNDPLYVEVSKRLRAKR